MNMTDNQRTYQELRDKYRWFTYESFSIEREKYQYRIRFHFNLNNRQHFYPDTVIPAFDMLNISEENWNVLAFHMGMIELVSYWKAACPPEVYIKPYRLEQDQMQWWKNLYFHGLGEFFHQNGIQASPGEFMQLFNLSEKPPPAAKPILEDHILVPVGGGKDSAVTLELLKAGGREIIPFAINPRPAIFETLDSAGIPRKKLVRAERAIDPLLLKLNEEGFLNGHTPFSAVVAFYGLLFASLTGSRHIALSNESSANEATIPGTAINHQYSKTYAFEHDFREYCRHYISTEYNYFSFLRPLNELQIGAFFAKFRKHYHTFKSCNRGSKDNIWCGECSKCLFTAAILAPFIERDTQRKIFGKDILDDKSLSPILDQLTGVAPEKPFECVGTLDDVNAALGKAGELWKQPQPALLQHYANHHSTAMQPFSKLLHHWNASHFLTADFEKLLKTAMDEKINT